MHEKYRFDGLSNSEIADMIDSYIRNKRDRKILKERLIDGVTFEQLAENYELSVRHTKRIVYNAISEIKNFCRV